MAAESSKGSWEDLRKEARYLENEIDIKLASFSKAGANATFAVISELDSDKTPLLSSSGDKTSLSESLSDEIESLLKKLSLVNSKMTEISSSTPGLLTRDAQHTLQRHRDILQDYSQEFKKTQNNLQSRREREELLHGAQSDIDKTSLNRRLDFYVKEHNSLKTSERLVDEQIAIAIETKENLVNQRFAFKKIQTRMNDLTSRFPALNNLISKINVKKKKDSIIIGIVIGLCIFLLFMYSLH